MNITFYKRVGFIENFALVIFFLISNITINHRSFAQGTEIANGAKSMALGDIRSCIKDEFAFTNNPAGAAEIKHINFHSSFKNRFTMAALNSIQFSLMMPVRKVVLGLNLQKFGDRLYSEQKIGIAAAHQINQVSLGTQIYLFQTITEELPTHWTWVGEFGGLIKLFKNVDWGLHIWNFNLASLSTKTEVELPTVLRSGINYTPNSKVSILAEIQKNIDHKANFHLGLEYKIVEWLCLRTGIRTQINTGAVGVGLIQKRWKLDFAISHQTWLGYTQQASLVWIFYTKKNKEIP